MIAARQDREEQSMTTAVRKQPTLSPAEALDLHSEALVIDSQQPGVTSGLLYTERMRSALHQLVDEGL
jgi:hypothetical protein